MAGPEKKKKKQSTAAAGGKPYDVQPGFKLKDDRRTFPRPSLERFKKIQMRLAPSSSLNDDILTFTHKTSNGELLRIGHNPIQIQYVVKEKNDDYEEDATKRAALTAAAELYKKLKYLACMMGASSSKSKRRAYLLLAAGAHLFFRECELFIDQEDISSHMKRQGELNGYYAYLMKIFSSEKERLELWDVDHLVTSTSEEEESTSSAFTSDMKKALETMNHVDHSSPVPKTIRTGFEGVPLMGLAQNPQVMKLAGLKPKPSYLILPPNTELTIQLKKHNPHDAYIEQMRVDFAGSTTNYDRKRMFSGQAQTKSPAKYILELQEVTVEADVMTLDMTQQSHRNFMARLEKNQISQRVDVPNTTILAVPAGQSRVHFQFDISPNTPVVYVYFVYRDNAIHNPASKHHNSFLLTFPENCSKISFSLGSEEILFDGGLKDLTVPGSSGKLRFYQYLKDWGIYDYSKPDYFSNKEDDYGLRAAFPLDLSRFGSLSEGKSLGVTMDFRAEGTDGSLSPENLLIFCSRVEMNDFGRSKEKRWFFGSL